MSVLLNPNCSEATMRLDVTSLTKTEAAELEKYMGELEADEEFWYETSWSIYRVGGKNILEIDGDVPYNQDDELRARLGKLKFWGKIDVSLGDYDVPIWVDEETKGLEL